MVTVDTEYVSVTEDADVLTLELARPDTLNALTPEMVEGMASAFEQLHEDPGPCILIDGEGRVTCAGMDQDIVAGRGYAEAHPDLDGETVAQLTPQLGKSRSRVS